MLKNIQLEVRLSGTSDVCDSFRLNEGGKADFEVRVTWSGEGDAPLSSAFLLLESLQNANGLDVFEVCSLPIAFTHSASTSERSHGSDVEDMLEMGVQCCRPVWIGTRSPPRSPAENPAFASKPILIAEAGGQLGIAGKIWDSSVVLIDFLSRHPEFIKGKRCIELGSGTGLVGIAGFLLGVLSIDLTDLEEAMPLLRTNIKLNVPSGVGNNTGTKDRSLHASTFVCGKRESHFLFFFFFSQTVSFAVCSNGHPHDCCCR